MMDSDHRTLVEIYDVRYRYRSEREPALVDLSFEIERGAVLGLVGPNGSGKTTLYRLILGLTRPTSGRVVVAGLAPHVYRMRYGIGYLPEQVRLPGSVRVRDFAGYVARLSGLKGGAATTAIDELSRMLALRERADAMIRTLSHGFRQRVGLLVALLGDPELLLFDEPANGLDPDSIGVLRSLLRSLKRRGRTVIVSSHNLLELERICDTVIILRQGRLLGRSSREELVGRPDIWVVQLGSEEFAGSPEAPSLFATLGGVQLAADEVAFADEQSARHYAAVISPAEGGVESIERRPFDLEYLFHSLVQGGSEEVTGL